MELSSVKDKVSVILPVYNEVNNLPALHQKLLSALDKNGQDFEIIFVDDSSSDGSYVLLKGLVSDKVKVIGLARNFGQTLAIQAGIDASCGSTIITMDADLQNDPSDIPMLLGKLKEGFDVVCGWRKKRRDPLFNKKIPSLLGNCLISLLFKVRLHDFGCGLKAYKRDAIANIRLYGEMHRILPLYVAMRGASIAEVEVSHNPRLKGKSHYGWSRAFKIGLDLITVRFFETYSTKPMYFFGAVGVGSSLLGGLTGVLVIIRAVAFKGMWVSPLLFISLMFFMMGIGLILMGLMAEIIIRIYYSSPGEHAYIVKEVIQK